MSERIKAPAPEPIQPDDYYADYKADQVAAAGKWEKHIQPGYGKSAHQITLEAAHDEALTEAFAREMNMDFLHGEALDEDARRDYDKGLVIDAAHDAALAEDNERQRTRDFQQQVQENPGDRKVS